MKNLIIFLCLLSLTSCMFYSGLYNVGLTEVERPANAKEQYGDYTIVNFEEDGKTKYSYEDDMIKIDWLVLSTQIGFALNNKTEHSIKIIWDEAVYVDIDGISQRIMHSGVKYTDKNASQPPTIIVRNGKITDMVVPTDNVYYVSGQYGGWQTKALFVSSFSTEEELNTIPPKYIGKTVQVLLPLQIEDVTNEYMFTFKVEDFIKN